MKLTEKLLLEFVKYSYPHYSNVKISSWENVGNGEIRIYIRFSTYESGNILADFIDILAFIYSKIA